MENCLPWEGPHTGVGAVCEEEGAAETTCDELTATSIPRPPVLLGGVGGREFWSEVETKKKGRVGGRRF